VGKFTILGADAGTVGTIGISGEARLGDTTGDTTGEIPGILGMGRGAIVGTYGIAGRATGTGK